MESHLRTGVSVNKWSSCKAVFGFISGHSWPLIQGHVQSVFLEVLKSSHLWCKLHSILMAILWLLKFNIWMRGMFIFSLRKMLCRVTRINRWFLFMIITCKQEGGLQRLAGMVIYKGNTLENIHCTTFLCSDYLQGWLPVCLVFPGASVKELHIPGRTLCWKDTTLLFLNAHTVIRDEERRQWSLS